ncbi:MAG: hypothetical protein GOMPHAMPRED_006529 [Gomphillus americanus]|uniref:Uncharacterized protein n=1 Tax=Gomphillus americanus TaxID=1940652 RepID=A0A8H3ILB1_9LECA|nr:MAG: hypothetical protein GOMPHAMPRED_006529 [Gomphillus americanus]
MSDPSGLKRDVFILAIIKFATISHTYRLLGREIPITSILASPITTSARPPPPPSPSIKELVITNSDLHTLDFDISHIPMETFLYNYVPINRHSTYDPSYIISKLPKTLKHLAILEEEILRLHHRRNDGYWELVVASSLIHFQQLKILWCFWPAIIPADADLENFDLSSVLPKSLTWLVLFSVPEEGVEMLTRALPKMPRLKMIWAQVQEFDGQERRFVVGSTQEVQLTNQFREAACKNGLSWTGPEHRSVFTSYVKYLDIHAWSGCLCENH